VKPCLSDVSDEFLILLSWVCWLIYMRSYGAYISMVFFVCISFIHVDQAVWYMILKYIIRLNIRHNIKKTSTKQ